MIAKLPSKGQVLKNGRSKLLENMCEYVLGVCSIQRKSLAGINLKEKKKRKFSKASHHWEEKREKGEKLQHVLIVTRKLYKHNLHMYHL